MCSKVERFPGVFPGTIKAPLDEGFLTQHSDLVCVGEVEGVGDETTVQYMVRNELLTFIRRLARFRIDRIEKGSVPESTIEIEFLQADFPSSLERLDKEEYLKVFLKKKNHRWQFANITTSKIVASRGH